MKYFAELAKNKLKNEAQQTTAAQAARPQITNTQAASLEFFQLPLRYKRKPITTEEADAINVSHRLSRFKQECNNYFLIF